MRYFLRNKTHQRDHMHETRNYETCTLSKSERESGVAFSWKFNRLFLLSGKKVAKFCFVLFFAQCGCGLSRKFLLLFSIPLYLPKLVCTLRDDTLFIENFILRSLYFTICLLLSKERIQR